MTTKRETITHELLDKFQKAADDEAHYLQTQGPVGAYIANPLLQQEQTPPGVPETSISDSSKQLPEGQTR